jgi:hypothetical protein
VFVFVAFAFEMKPQIKTIATQDPNPFELDVHRVVGVGQHFPQPTDQFTVHRFRRVLGALGQLSYFGKIKIDGRKFRCFDVLFEMYFIGQDEGLGRDEEGFFGVFGEDHSTKVGQACATMDFHVGTNDL